MAKKSKWGHDVHRYQKLINGKGTAIWRCTLPNCRHYLVDRMVLGQLSVCNRCDNEVFEMKIPNLDQKKPHCLKCTRPHSTKGRKGQTKDTIKDILGNLDDLLNLH